MHGSKTNDNKKKREEEKNNNETMLRSCKQLIKFFHRSHVHEAHGSVFRYLTSVPINFLKNDFTYIHKVIQVLCLLPVFDSLFAKHFTFQPPTPKQHLASSSTHSLCSLSFASSK